jgi:hypothetical protein
VLLVFAFAAGLMALFPSAASAIPAWSRKFDVPCATCHYPAPPRLNAYGHKFRRAQMRTPEEFNKEPEWKKVGNYVALRVRGRYNYESNEDPGLATGGVTSGFALNDATLFYAGPVAKNFSGFVELERPGDDEIIEAVVSVGGIMGKPDNFYTFRLGQFHTLTRVGWGGLDRPTGISTPMALSRALVAGDDFKLNQDQVGLEGTWVHKNHRLIGQILNGGDYADAATTDRSDENQAKDYQLAYELMWGDLASGLTVFVYNGTANDPSDDGKPVPPTPPDIVTLQRIGVTAAHDFKGGFEVQGGYIKGTDDYDLPVMTVDSVDGEGWWIELEKYFKGAKDLTIFTRYDFQDPNTDKNATDDQRTQLVLGFSWPVGEWHARWGMEYRMINQEFVGVLAVPPGDYDDTQVVGELMLNF